MGYPHPKDALMNLAYMAPILNIVMGFWILLVLPEAGHPALAVACFALLMTFNWLMLRLHRRRQLLTQTSMYNPASPPKRFWKGVRWGLLGSLLFAAHGCAWSSGLKMGPDWLGLVAWQWSGWSFYLIPLAVGSMWHMFAATSRPKRWLTQEELAVRNERDRLANKGKPSNYEPLTIYGRMKFGKDE